MNYTSQYMKFSLYLKEAGNAANKGDLLSTKYNLLMMRNSVHDCGDMDLKEDAETFENDIMKECLNNFSTKLMGNSFKIGVGYHENIEDLDRVPDIDFLVSLMNGNVCELKPYTEDLKYIEAVHEIIENCHMN